MIMNKTTGQEDKHQDTLRFRDYRDTWSIRRFEQLVSLRKEKFDPHKNKFPQRDIELDNIESTTGRIIGFIESSTQKSIKNVFYKNDILYSKLRPYLQKFTQAPWDGVASSELWVFRPKDVTSDFLLQLVQTKTFIDAVNVQSGSKMPRAEWSIVKLTEFAIPTIPEQQKIASFLTAIDQRITNQQQKLSLLKDYKKGVMQKIFAQQVRFKDENGEAYPEWEEKRLGELEDLGHIKLGRGNVISKVDIANYPGTYPIFSSSVKNEGLFGRYGKYMFDEELVTWSIDGGGHFFYRPKQRFSITNVSGWIRILHNTIDCRFLALQLQTLHERQVFDYTIKAHPSVIRNIYTFKLPDIREQQKIAELLTSIDDKIKAEENLLTSAKAWKKGLLQRMFI